MKYTKEEILSKARKIHKSFYSYDNVDDELLLDKRQLVITCPIHGDFIQKVTYHLHGKGCRKCSDERCRQRLLSKYTVDDFINESRNKFGEHFSYDKTIDSYKSKSDKCIIHCNIHNIDFEVQPSSHLRGNGACPMCLSETRAKKNKKTLDDFIKKAKERFGENIIYNETKYDGQYTETTFECIKHGYFRTTPKAFLHSTCGCPYCAEEIRRQKRSLSSEEVISRCNKTHLFKYDYSHFKYKTIWQPCEIICHEKYSDGTEHGSFWQTPHNHIKGNGCPKCNISKLEETVMRSLREKHVDFIHEASKKDLPFLERQRLDFYLKKYNIAIECQGVQHFLPTDFANMGEKYAEELLEANKERDLKKKEICRENKITLIYFIPVNFVSYMGDNDVYFTDITDLMNFIFKK